MANNLDYADIKYQSQILVSKKYYSKIEEENSIFINMFSYENNLVYPVHVSDKKFEDCMDLLL